jgi:hypothetical protein
MQQRGTLNVDFLPKTNKRNLDFNPFFADPSIANEIKNRLDQELKRRGINVKQSKIEPDPRNFGLKYQAEYDPPKRYGVAGAVATAVKVVLKAVVQAIKAIVKFIVNAIKQIVKFIQKLIIKISTLIQYFNQAMQRWVNLAEGTQNGEIDPNNPENDLDKIEQDVDRTGGSSSAFNFGSPWVVLGAVALVGIVWMMRK